MAASINAASVARLHTVFAAAAFTTALVVGCALHYKKIVKNGVAQYPDEWFPSVSSTIGDWYPERNLFQILIALASGPRFALVFLQYFLHHSTTSSLPTIVFISGILRTLSCGGWVYITSSDDHDIHDFMMILYIVCNIPWMLVGSASSSKSSASVQRKRKLISGAFFGTIVPLIYFFLQHKVHRVPGAYTRYAFFEWGLIFFDVVYDSIAEQEFREAGLEISFTKSESAIISISHAAITIADESTKPQIPPPTTPIKPSNSTDKAMTDAVDAALSPSTDHTSQTPTSNSPSIATPAWRESLSFLSDVYLSYIFWTLFTALIPTLFYFSVWKLGIAGNELALLSVLSPCLLSLRLSSPYNLFFSSSSASTSTSTSTSTTGSAPANTNTHAPSSRTFLDFAQTRHGQVILQLTSLLGIAAYIVPNPGGRLVLVAAANAAAMMRQAVVWAGVVHGDRDGDVEYHAIVTGLGVLVASLAKQANRSNNPVWPFINHKAGGCNKTGIIIALLAIYEYSSRPTPPPSNPTTQPKPSPIHDQQVHSPSPPTRTRSPSFLAALPLGSLLFCIHNLLSDSSTLIAQSWTGYEHGLPRGPVPHLHGALTFVAMAFGLLVAMWSVSPPNDPASKGKGAGEGEGKSKVNGTSKEVPVLAHQMYFHFGAASMWVMYTYRDWVGYAGGLGVAVFLTSILPLVFRTAAVGSGSGRLGVAKTYTIAMGVYCLLNLASIFTVAYAFVPGGVYLRERTDIVTIAQLLCLLPAFNLPFSTSTSRAPSTSTTNHTRPHSLSSKYKSHIQKLLFSLSLLSLLTTVYRLPRAPPQPFKPGPRIINTGIWTVHFGIDNEGHDSQRGMMNVIRDMELDIVGLLETDLHRTAFGHRDLSRLIVEEMNYNVDIGPGPNSHTWGAVLLSKFPIIKTKHHLLPSPNGELAPAIEAILDVYGTEVLVIVAHNGQEEDALDRELQSSVLALLMATSPRPVIFLGYVVTKPWAPRPSPYGILVDEGNVHDIDVDDVDRWCEYIFYRGLYRTSYARISRGIITDTETQIGQFVLPRHGHTVTNDTKAARYLRSRKEDLPVEHWFPMEYYGDANQGGVNGHYYHVFNTPLYYKLPEDAIV